MPSSMMSSRTEPSSSMRLTTTRDARACSRTLASADCAVRRFAPDEDPADGRRIVGWTVGRGRQRGIDLGEAQAAHRKRVMERLALGKAEAQLRSLVTGANDLVEDRQGVGAVTQVGDVDVVPEDRNGPDPCRRQCVAGAPERKAPRADVTSGVGHP